MENKYVYVLQGSRGHYDDWIVDVYTTEEKAHEACDKLNKASDMLIEVNKVFVEHNECVMIDIPRYRVTEAVLRD